MFKLLLPAYTMGIRIIWPAIGVKPAESEVDSRLLDAKNEAYNLDSMILVIEKNGNPVFDILGNYMRRHISISDCDGKRKRHVFAAIGGTRALQYKYDHTTFRIGIPHNYENRCKVNASCMNMYT